MTRVEVSPPAQVNTLSSMLPSATVPESMTISKYFLDVSRLLELTLSFSICIFVLVRSVQRGVQLFISDTLATLEMIALKFLNWQIPGYCSLQLV